MLLDLERLRACELAYPAAFAEWEERPYGRLYYNVENPTSHDSNHAVLTTLEGDLDAIIGEVIAFYRVKGLTPRFYSDFLPDEPVCLRPRLAARGFQFADEALRLFVLQGPSRIRPNPALKVRRVRALDADLIALINSEREEEWTVKTLERHLRRESLHHLVGYVGETPVTMASLVLMDGLSQVNNVMTHVAHRGQGYARTLMHALVCYYRCLSADPLYLFAQNPTAIRLYEEAGFVADELLQLWAAYLPEGAGSASGLPA